LAHADSALRRRFDEASILPAEHVSMTATVSVEKKYKLAD